MFDGGGFSHHAGLAGRQDFGPLPDDALDARLGHDGAAQSFDARLLAGTLRLVLLERNKDGLAIGEEPKQNCYILEYVAVYSCRAAMGLMAITGQTATKGQIGTKTCK